MKLRQFIAGCKRVLKLAKKPTLAEYRQALKFLFFFATIFGIIGLILTIIFLIIK
ncbi:MAG: protein translocase SEC61 complex subunit gamma [bacterium]|nr:protein translocase SEC61 complex subunit gamma [bacterium]